MTFSEEEKILIKKVYQLSMREDVEAIAVTDQLFLEPSVEQIIFMKKITLLPTC